MHEGGHRPSTGRERDSSSLVPEIPARGWEESKSASPADECGARARVHEPSALPPLHDATFEQWLENVNRPTHTIMNLHPSVWDRDDVLPSLVFYAGPGGVSKGSVTIRDGKYVITALAIESVDYVCATHRLNNPSVPVLRMRLDDHRAALWVSGSLRTGQVPT